MVVLSMVSFVQKLMVGGMLVSENIMIIIMNVNIGLCLLRFLKLLIVFVLKLWCVSSIIMLNELSVVIRQMIVQNIVELQVFVGVVVLFFMMFVSRLSSMKFMFEIVEYVSICLMLCWMILVMLLMISDSVVRIMSVVCQFCVSGSRFIIRKCRFYVNVVIFGLLLMNSVIVVGVFWQMFGIYMWNGMVLSLNVILVMMKIMLNISMVVLVLLLIVLYILLSLSELVVLQSIEMLYSMKFDVSVFSMQYFIVVLFDCVVL